MLSRLSRAVLSVAIFVIATIVLWLLYDKGILPFLIFIIGFGLLILLIVFIWMASDTWQEIPVIPIRRKKKY